MLFFHLSPEAQPQPTQAILEDLGWFPGPAGKATCFSFWSKTKTFGLGSCWSRFKYVLPAIPPMIFPLAITLQWCWLFSPSVRQVCSERRSRKARLQPQLVQDALLQEQIDEIVAPTESFAMQLLDWSFEEQRKNGKTQTASKTVPLGLQTIRNSLFTHLSTMHPFSSSHKHVYYAIAFLELGRTKGKRKHADCDCKL